MDFIFKLIDERLLNARTISEFQYIIKYKLLTNYREEDFDLSKLFIGVTTFKGLRPNINIYSDFENLEDAINCCIASSHIPFVTGGLTNKYNDLFSFDGGFSNYPYLNTSRIIHINPSIWSNIEEFIPNSITSDASKNKINNSVSSNSSNSSNLTDVMYGFKPLKSHFKSLKNFKEIFSLSRNNLLELFDNGYQDAKNQKHNLDKIFIVRKTNDYP